MFIYNTVSKIINEEKHIKGATAHNIKEYISFMNVS